MGKHRHTKDRIYISATEWAEEYGGKKDRNSGVNSKPLAFDHCALSLVVYETPACLQEGVIFDLENIVDYILKYKKNPITGETATKNDIIRLNMAKNEKNEWMCPVLNKVFTNFSHIVAIKTTGNVFSYEAVDELNIKAKNYTDLISGESFKKSDILTLQNPKDEVHMKLRDINNFEHLKSIRDDHSKSLKSDEKIRYNPVAEKVMKEIALENQREADGIIKKTKIEDLLKDNSLSKSFVDDIKEFFEMKPTIEDVNPGQLNTDGRASSSLTSTSVPKWSSNETRLATPNEIREALWKQMRLLGKKGYAQLQTNFGNLNLEIHCNIAPQTSFNFLTLCEREYFDSTSFHRLVSGFMVQGGDPTGSGSGGDSCFGGEKFKDEFDTRILHDSRGVLSMANSGIDSNGSQFFILFRDAKHLDMKHTAFGRVVGGAATLDRIEAVGNDKKEHPLQQINILKAVVFTNPISEAQQNLKNFILKNIDTRISGTKTNILPLSNSVPLLKRTREVDEKDTSNSKKVNQTKVAAFLKSQFNY